MSLIDEVRAILSQKPNFEEVIAKLKDTSIPLFERWEAFSELVDNNGLTSIKTYGDGFVYTLDKSLELYDDFHVERHETMLYTDMLETIRENSRLERLLGETVIDAWKEKVLAEGYAGFKHDW